MPMRLQAHVREALSAWVAPNHSKAPDIATMLLVWTMLLASAAVYKYPFNAYEAFVPQQICHTC